MGHPAFVGDEAYFALLHSKQCQHQRFLASGAVFFGPRDRHVGVGLAFCQTFIWRFTGSICSGEDGRCGSKSKYPYRRP